MIFTVFCGLFLFTFTELTNCVKYEPNLKVGQVNVHLPETPPKNPEIKSIYYDAEVFAHYYDKMLQKIQKSNNKFRSVRVAKKFEKDFNRDLNNLKLHLRRVNYNAGGSVNPSISDATLFQLVTEFIRKLSMISIQTHCFIYGCDNLPIMPGTTSTLPSSEPTETESTEDSNNTTESPPED